MVEKKQWIKQGGGTFRMKNGRIIKPMQKFSALESEIPEAFRDTIKELPLQTVTIIDNQKQEISDKDVNTPELQIQERSPGWFDVIDKDGKKVNEQALKEPEAEAMIEALS